MGEERSTFDAIRAVLKASTFGDVYVSVAKLNSAHPLALPNPMRQLGRLVTSIFTMVPEGELHAPAAGRLMFEVSTALLLVAVEDEASGKDKPLPWETVAKRDLYPVYVTALLWVIKPEEEEEWWYRLAGNLFTTWSKKGHFDQKDLDELETLAKEILNEQH